MLLGFTASASTSGIRSKLECGEVDVDDALFSGGLAVAGGYIGKFAGATVPIKNVNVERGFLGRMAERIGIIGPKTQDVNAGLRTNVATGVGVTVENILSGANSK